MSKRARRTTRNLDRGKIRVTERDLWIFEAMAKMRFLTTSQFARLFFKGSRWSANKRLRRLLDSGLVKVWVRSLSEDNIYALSAAGARALADNEQRSASSGARPPRGLDGNLNHLLAINGVRIALALSLPQAGGEITWWRSDWELRSHGRERIIPDAIFSIKWDGLQEQTCALEVDHNTKSPRSFLKKILGYAALRGAGRTLYGVSDPIVLVAGSDPKWLERYRLSLGQVGLAARTWFAALDEVVRQGATDPIWMSAIEDKKYSLRDLTFLPNGKERRPYENSRLQRI